MIDLCWFAGKSFASGSNGYHRWRLDGTWRFDGRNPGRKSGLRYNGSLDWLIPSKWAQRCEWALAGHSGWLRDRLRCLWLHRHPLECIKDPVEFPFKGGRPVYLG